MSVDKWAYIPNKCDGDYCFSDCDNCPKALRCPPMVNKDGTCAADAEMCEVCWNTFGPVPRKTVPEPPKEET